MRRTSTASKSPYLIVSFSGRLLSEESTLLGRLVAVSQTCPAPQHVQETQNRSTVVSLNHPFSIYGADRWSYRRRRWRRIGRWHVSFFRSFPSNWVFFFHFKRSLMGSSWFVNWEGFSFLVGKHAVSRCQWPCVRRTPHDWRPNARRSCGLSIVVDLAYIAAAQTNDWSGHHFFPVRAPYLSPCWALGPSWKSSPEVSGESVPRIPSTMVFIRRRVTVEDEEKNNHEKGSLNQRCRHWCVGGLVQKKQSIPNRAIKLC